MSDTPVPRRSLLRGLALGAIGAPLVAAFGAPSVAAAGTRGPFADGTLAVTVTNDSGAAGNDAVRLYVVGTDLATGAQAHADAGGNLIPVSLSDNGSDGYTDYSIPLAGSGDTTIALPHMSGRIYFALGDPLRFKAVPDGNGNPALAYPAGWVESDPNYPVLHDFFEFTYDGSGMHCNNTQVDMFGVPSSVHLVGAADQTTGTLEAGGRGRIFAEVAAQAGFGSLVLDDLRVIAPGHGIEVGRFAADYFDGYLDDVWSKYAGETLTVHTGGADRTGRVTGGMFTFDDGVAPISKPTTSDVFFCAGALAAPNDGLTGPVAAALGAGFNRSTLLASASQPTDDPAGFYATDPTNHYARIMHAHMTDGRAYGFPFDDVGGFASYIEDGAPTALHLTLTAFS
jgi:hypothetical protein